MFQPIIWKCYNNHFQKSWMDSGWILYCFKICDLESHVWAGRRLAESEKSPKCLRFFTKTLFSFSFTQNNFTLSHQQKSSCYMAITECSSEDGYSHSEQERDVVTEFQEGELGKSWTKLCREEAMELRMVCLGRWKGDLVKNFRVQQYRDERIKAVEPWSF